jgi:hypothetical protein
MLAFKENKSDRIIQQGRWEADSHSAGKEISRHLIVPTFRLRTFKRSPMDCIDRRRRRERKHGLFNDVVNWNLTPSTKVHYVVWEVVADVSSDGKSSFSNNAVRT